MKRSVILNSTSAQGKKLQKSFTDVNPEATGQSLKTFSQKVNALTTATYNSTDMVDKYNLDTETPPNPPATPTLSLYSSSVTVSGNSTELDVTYTGDGDVYIEPTNTTKFFAYTCIKNDALKLIITKIGSPSGSESFTLKATATDNYTATSFEFTVSPS